MPTETEWEHACRAGTSTPFHFGSDLNGNQANCDGNYPYGTFDKGLYLAGTSEVGKYPANPWGLQDMHGNVWEWCLDGSDYPCDRVLSVEENFRIRRGGSWFVFAQYCRSAYRSCGNPKEKHDDAGLRLCLAEIK